MEWCGPPEAVRTRCRRTRSVRLHAWATPTHRGPPRRWIRGRYSRSSESRDLHALARLSLCSARLRASQRAVVSRGATAVAYWGSLVSVRLPGFYELHPRSSCSCDGAGEHVSDPHAGRHRLRFFSRREATGLLPRVCDASRRAMGPCQCSPPSHARVEPRDDRAHHVRVSPESGIFTVPG